MVGAVTGNALGAMGRRAAGVAPKGAVAAISYPLPTSGFNTADAGGTFNLYAGGHAASGTNSGGRVLIRGAKGIQPGSGKFYIEGYSLIGAPIGNGYLPGWGIANKIASLSAQLGTDTNSIGWITNSSVIYFYYNGGSLSSGASGGQVIGIAIDTNAGLWWAMIEGAPVSGNPVTGVGGNALPSGILYIAAQSGYARDAAWVNTGQVPFLMPPPQGFNQPWG